MSSDDLPILTTWQSIIVHRTFTQSVIQQLLDQTTLRPAITHLISTLQTTQTQDGFARSEMDEFATEQFFLYRHIIPDQLWGLLSQDKIFTWEETTHITQVILSALTQDHEWKVYTLPKKRVFSVIRSKKLVHVPQKPVHSRKFAATLFHELIVHVLRYIQHQITLPGYKTFEEGLASSLQMYILGQEEITFGKNKVRDFLLLLWELGIQTDDIRYLFDFMIDKSIIHNKNYSWKKMFFERLNRSHKEHIKMKTRYKIYTLGAYRFYQFLEQYNSTNNEIRKNARKLSKILLKAKFDPMNPSHINTMNEIKFASN